MSFQMISVNLFCHVLRRGFWEKHKYIIKLSKNEINVLKLTY
jgi:hypothetical protein